MKNTFFALLLALLLVATLATAITPVPLFSALKAGDKLPAELRLITLPKIKPNATSLIDDQGITVLKVESNNSAGSIALPFKIEPAKTPLLTWRWKASNVLAHADMDLKTGDDFAGRVYVFFDVPLASLPFMERSKIRLVRMVAGADVPTAALCYVWDNKHRVGYTAWSPYSNRVRKIVLQSGPDNIGKWMRESRDVAADFREAFGIPAPAITGVAIGNDTDNTDDAVVTWFGDVAFHAK